MTSKTLYILRHAQAAGSIGGDDFARVLTQTGQEDAKALGVYFSKKGYQIDSVLCSPSKRTRETYGALNLDVKSENFSEILYNAMAGDLFKTIQGVADDVESILLVAHNPGVLELLSLLCDPGDDRQAAKLSDQLMVGYQPATLSVLKCGCESWTDLQPAQNELADLVSPLDYSSSERPTRWM